jgi:hypothetical protein
MLAQEVNQTWLKMGITMIRSLVLSAVLLPAFLLASGEPVSARTCETIVPSEWPATQLRPFSSAADPSRILGFLTMTAYTGGGNQSGNGDGNKYGNGDDAGRKDHDQTPEPSTLLSFGAALLIGGGVLYSRRLRRKRN